MSERFKVTLNHDEDDDDRYRATLRVEHDGTVLYERHDGGEPEDNSFRRDWSWVPEAISEAYSLGLADGQASPNARQDSEEKKTDG